MLVIVSVACQREEKDFIKPIPLALEASAINSSGFIANWKAMLGAKDYIFEVSDSEVFDSLVRDFPQTTADTTYIVTGLEASRSYYYRIKASKYNGPTDYSKSVKVLTAGLAVPTALDAAEVTSTSFKAQWKKMNGVSSYLLYVAEDANFTNILSSYNGKEISDTVCTVSKLEINKNYFYRIKSKRGESISDFSAMVVTATSELSTPVLLESTNLYSKGFTLHWNSVPDAISYLVFISKDPLMTNTLSAYTAREVALTSLEVTNLEPNTFYYYRVQAQNKTSISGKSDIASIKTVALPVPTSLPAQNIQTHSFLAHWEPVLGANGYQVDVALDADFGEMLPEYDNIVTSSNTLSVSGLSMVTPYFYRVRALVGQDASENSDIITLKTKGLVPPSSLSSSNIMLYSFTAHWKKVAGATAYHFDLSADPLFSVILPDYSGVKIEDTVLAVSNLSPGKKYYFRVRATDEVAVTANSEVGVVETTYISAPTALSPTDINVLSFVSHWEAVSGIDSYLLDVAYDENFSIILPNYSNKLVTGTEDTVDGLEPSTTYYYRVRSMQGDSYSKYSNTIAVETSDLPPPLIDTLTNNARKAFEFNAHWQNVDMATSYLLYIAEDVSFTNAVAGYQGKEIVGTSWKVTQLDPYKTYYYKVKSKRYQKLSDYSAAITVAGVVNSSCRLAAREYTGAWRETYDYTNGLLTEVNLYDLADNHLERRSTINYTSDGLVDVVLIEYDNSGVMQPYTTYTCTYEGGKLATVNVDDNYGNFYEMWRFVYSNNLLTEFKRFSDVAEASLKYKESYQYDTYGRVIVAKDTSDQTIKKFTYNENFNGEHLIPSELQMLLYDLTRSSENPFSYEYDLSYYQYLESGMWNSFSYTYQYNNQGIPTKLLGQGNVPDLSYEYDNCDF